MPKKKREVSEPSGGDKPMLKRKARKQLTMISEARLSQEIDVDLASKIKKENFFSASLWIMLSSSFTVLLVFLIEGINLVFIGKARKCDENISAVGMGNLYLNIFGVLVAYGVISGFEAVGSQVYGTYRFRQLGIYSMRTRLILNAIFLVLCLPLGLLSHIVLTFLGLPPLLVRLTSEYVILMLPSLVLSFNLLVTVKFLQIMEIYLVPSLFALLGLLLHVFLCLCFILHLDWETKGVAAASFITMLLCLIVFTSYTLMAKNCVKANLYRVAWDVFDLVEFIPYFKHCLYSGLQYYADYLGLAALVFMSSFLSFSSLASSIIMVNYSTVIGVIYLGMSYPLTQMIGLFLGRRELEMVDHALRNFVRIFITLSFIFCGCTYFLSAHLAELYSANEKLSSKTVTICSLLSFGIFFDVYNVLLQAVLKGVGKHSMTFLWVFFFWMLPVSYVLCFLTELDYIGLWFGYISYVILLTLVNFLNVVRLDWTSVSEEINAELEENELRQLEDNNYYYVLNSEDSNSV